MQPHIHCDGASPTASMCLLGGMLLSKRHSTSCGNAGLPKTSQSAHLNHKAHTDEHSQHQAREEASSRLQWDARSEWRRKGKPNRG